jgi:protein ImuA
MSTGQKSDLLKSLQSDILRLQGFRSNHNATVDMGLEPIRHAFPNGIFPLGAVHEFISAKTEDLAATSGFVSGILSTLMANKGVTLWVSANRTLFPPALKSFHIDPERIIFIDLKKEKDVLWVMDEALKCCALKTVVAEVRDLDFNSSRRFQLSSEESQVTGILIRSNYRTLGTTACVSRWKVTSLPSGLEEGLPGVGFPKWQVELLRVRNGRPASWEISWVNGRFSTGNQRKLVTSWQQEKAG